MVTNVLMPALSPTMEQGKLSKWLKKEGDVVRSGDVLAEIETDKATMEVEAADDGTLTKILVPDGTDNVTVNTPIAVIAGDGEDAAPVEAPPYLPLRQSGPEVDEAWPPAKAAQAKAALAPAKSSNLEIPEGTAMISQSVREALRDAMPKKCAAMEMFLLSARRSPNTKAPIKSRKGCCRNLAPAGWLIRRSQ